MLHKVKSTYGEIAKYFPELCDKLSLSEYNKQILLEIARKGKPRPYWRTPLGAALNRYANKGLSYDPIFAVQIRKAAPHWFFSRSNVASQKKTQLLEMAQGREKRPSRTHPIGKRLSDYTNKHSSSYDPIFNKKIRRLAPHWFVPKSEMVKQKRNQLLEMAERGRKKPSRGSQLVGLLYKLTNKHSSSYDPIFNKKIRRLTPHWFESSSQPKKDILLKIAKDKGLKPKDKDHFGMALRRYTRKDSSSYDPYFTSKIRRLAPHWFVSTSRANKDLLIDMAKKKIPKPNQKTKLGQALKNYTSRTSFAHDPTFTRKIKKLAPHWFRKKCSTK